MEDLVSVDSEFHKIDLEPGTLKEDIIAKIHVTHWSVERSMLRITRSDRNRLE